MSKTSISSLVFVLALAVAGNVCSQTVLGTGDKVRVTVKNPAPESGNGTQLLRNTGFVSVLTGTVYEVSENTLTVEVNASPGLIVIPRSQIHGVEISHGVNRGAGAFQGGAIGFAVGAVTGAVLGLMASTTDESDTWHFSRSSYAAIGTIVFGGVGLATGAIIGGTRGKEEWERVPAPFDGIGLELGPGPQRGLAVSFSRRF